jgi:hypothetical protein
MDEMFGQVAQSVLTLFLGAIGDHLWKSRKRLQFIATDWSFQYMKNSSPGSSHFADKIETEIAEDKGQLSSVRYSFTVKIFNEKSESTGLHDFSVEFMKGKSFQQERLVQHDEVRDASVRRSPGYEPPKLGEIQQWPDSELEGLGFLV